MDGLAPSSIRWEGSPPRRKVDRSADDIALNTYRLELSEGKPLIADQGSSSASCSLARWSRRVVRRFRSYRSTRPVRGDRDGQTLRADRPNARRDAQRNGR